MKKKQIILILFFVFSVFQIVNAQENKLVVLNLKNGYSVKGEIIEQTSQGVKIKTLNGEIFEYNANEISSTTDAKISSKADKIFSPTKVVAQSIAPGDKLINIGIGIFRLPSIGYYEKLTIPSIPISFEYIIKNNLFNGNGALGIGGFLGYSASKYESSYYNSKDSRLIIGARGYAHYALVEKLDTYSGLLLGYKSDVFGYDSDQKYNDAHLTLNIFAGCRYFFTDKIAGMAELGWGTSILTIGVAVKL